MGDKKRVYKRNMRVDEMGFDPDGSIQELRWTEDGPPALKNLDPYKPCVAACLNASDVPLGPHAVTTEACSEGGVDLCGIDDGDWVRYANVDFGDNFLTKFTVRVACGGPGGAIEVHLDRLDGPLLATCPVPNTGGWQSWQDVFCRPKEASGVHAMYLKFTGKDGGNPEGLFHFERYRFSHEVY